MLRKARFCGDAVGVYRPGFSAWGSFAELVAIPVADRNRVRLPDGVDFNAAAALGCRYMTAFAAVAVRGRVRSGASLAVHGCGGVGRSAVMLAKALGAALVAIDIDQRALALALEPAATHAIDARAPTTGRGQVTEPTAGGAHVSIDALGSAITCAGSVRCLRKRGRHVQVGLLGWAPKPSRRCRSRRSSPTSSRSSGARDDREPLPALLLLVACGAVLPDWLIKRRIALTDAGAIAAMGRHAVEGITVFDHSESPTPNSPDAHEVPLQFKQQASAGERSAPPRSCIRSKAAATPALSDSMPGSSEWPSGRTT